MKHPQLPVYVWFLWCIYTQIAWCLGFELVTSNSHGEISYSYFTIPLGTCIEGQSCKAEIYNLYKHLNVPNEEKFQPSNNLKNKSSMNSCSFWNVLQYCSLITYNYCISLNSSSQDAHDSLQSCTMCLKSRIKLTIYLSLQFLKQNISINFFVDTFKISAINFHNISVLKCL